MVIVNQKGKEIKVCGDVELTKNTILYNSDVLGKYTTDNRAIEVYSMLVCHSWSKQLGAFVMPEN